MKFMHLADLHIGKVVNGFSMLEDQQHILAQIMEYVREHQPQALLIAGDVYDKPVPGTEAVRVFDQFLTELAAEKTQVLLISGNHDSPERLAFGGRIMAEQGVHLCGAYEKELSPVMITDEYGEVRFYLLPFLRPSSVRRYFEEEKIESYHDAVSVATGALPLDESMRNVLVAHQFVVAAGEEPERSESEVGPVGGIDSVNVYVLERFDYVALGHLHGPQRVREERFRYAGSPLKYSFSECHHNKSVTLVEMREKGDVRIEKLPLKPCRDLRKIKGPLDVLTSQEVVSQGNSLDYLHVTLTDQGEVLDAMGKLRSVYPNVMALEFADRKTADFVELPDDFAVENQSPQELFASFFEMQNGEKMSDAQAEIAENFLREIGGAR